MRKLMLSHAADFPTPVHDGSAALWHLVHVLQWLKERGTYDIEQSVLDVAHAAMQNQPCQADRATCAASSKAGSSAPTLGDEWSRSRPSEEANRAFVLLLSRVLGRDSIDLVRLSGTSPFPALRRTPDRAFGSPTVCWSICALARTTACVSPLGRTVTVILSA